jgi:hypothetical protein
MSYALFCADSGRYGSHYVSTVLTTSTRPCCAVVARAARHFKCMFGPSPATVLHSTHAPPKAPLQRVGKYRDGGQQSLELEKAEGPACRASPGLQNLAGITPQGKCFSVTALLATPEPYHISAGMKHRIFGCFLCGCYISNLQATLVVNSGRKPEQVVDFLRRLTEHTAEHID